jgi:acyl transferase domain-containing protein
MARDRTAMGDIAVIGLGCRFPGDATSPDEFFDMLLNKRSGWTEVPKDRFTIDSFWHPSYDRHGSMVGRGGHFLKEDISLFDAPVSNTLS